jgi:RNA-directed DNA polymerase
LIIDELQRKLATWTATDPTRRVDRLLRLIAEHDWLTEAARITLSSSGAKSPGVDGVTKQHLGPDVLPDYLEHIREELLSEEYTPAPARRIYILKANGKRRPLGIATLRDRIVQRAMLMAMQPIWENDFHNLSYGFRPERSVHHAIRTVKLQLTDNTDTRGRWVIEGDLASYFDTVHHRLLMKSVRKRIRDNRFMSLLWKMVKAGHVDAGLFRAASEGVAQGGVLSPLLSNIMLNEFDQYLEERYLSKKARKDRWYNNYSVKVNRPSAKGIVRTWKPSVAYCRYADDFVIVVKGTKDQANQIREECRRFLEQELKLTLNMEKTHLTHVNDGFVFLGHRIVRKRSRFGDMRIYSMIPKEKARNFRKSLAILLSGNHGDAGVDVVRKLNARLLGWSTFYRFVDNRAVVFSRIDRTVFWKFAHWMARKYRCRIKSLLMRWVKSPEPKASKTWVLYDTARGQHRRADLQRLVGRSKSVFRWRGPSVNPYLRTDERKTITSRYADVAIAMSNA